MIIVSACLAGFKCRYDGDSCHNDYVYDLLNSGQAIAVCPEELGGLPTPRVPCEIIDGKVISKNGVDCSEEFNKGAQEVLKIAIENDCKLAILKANSPSCGSNVIYDGSFSGRKIAGDGITSKLLKENGIEVKTENEL